MERYGAGRGARREGDTGKGGTRAVPWKQRWVQGRQEGSTPTTKREQRQGGYGLPETVMLKGWQERAKPLNEMAQAACPGKVPSIGSVIKVSLLPLSCPRGAYPTGGSG